MVEHYKEILGEVTSFQQYPNIEGCARKVDGILHDLGPMKWHDKYTAYNFKNCMHVRNDTGVPFLSIYFIQLVVCLKKTWGNETRKPSSSVKKYTSKEIDDETNAGLVGSLVNSSEKLCK